MKSDLRKNPQRSLGRYWLALSDASAFTMIRTAIGIADRLRCDLAQQVGVACAISAPEVAVALLSAAEGAWGKAKAAQLMGELADLKGLAGSARARAWILLRDSVASLPATLWAQEKLALRRELLDELDRQAQAARNEEPPLPSKLELREQQWRDSVSAPAPSSSSGT